jgi:hypothetical protein
VDDPLIDLRKRQLREGKSLEIGSAGDGRRAVTAVSLTGEVITGFGATDQEAAAYVLVRLMSHRVTCGDCGREHLHSPKTLPSWLERIDTSTWVRLEGCDSQPNDVYRYSPLE